MKHFFCEGSRLAKDGRYTIEIAQCLPGVSINFYVDACRAMSAVDLRTIQDRDPLGDELKRTKSLIGAQRKNPQAAIEILIHEFGKRFCSEDVKLVGYFMLTHLREGEFNEHRNGNLLKLPFTFISFAIVEDLKLHGQGPCYSLVEKFLDELAEDEIIDGRFHGLQIRSRCTKYHGAADVTAMFLGYSLAATGDLLPVVPFPCSSIGFVSRLMFELKKLLPAGEIADTFLKSENNANNKRKEEKVKEDAFQQGN